MEQLRISSLLSPSIEPERDLSASKSQNVPQSPTQQARQGSNPPKVILPTQKAGGNALAKNDSPDAPGVLVARISSPVNLSGEKASGQTKKPAVAATSSAGGKVAEKEKKVSLTATVPSKPKANTRTAGEGRKVSKTVKKDATAPATSKSGSEKSTASKGQSENENGGKQNSEKTTAKKEGKKTASKVSDKKEGGVPSKAGDTKKKAAVKKEQSSSTKGKTPKKLVAAPAIKSPSLLDLFERGKVTKEIQDPTIVLDVPLYSSKTNEYLDENGQVSFNFYKLVHDKFHATQSESNITDVKVAKRNLLTQLNTTNTVGNAEDEEGEDLVEVDDEGDDDEEDEGDEEKIMASPKKKSHPNKGKSLIGKYDIEDPFIDDSELLWEEQRAATKDGFFVYFGPLIEKGHYGSLERTDGTMKRGGVKNK
ncbi:hypothetical protein HG536_0H03710 [Torulaspora globosa]|uniref:Hpc2-related domain-containing protein n=1 Tax=Torulaspora globosa TaxID=48254 RepID=A0A7G3ZNA9_9SACH|nr:uncharacterized protein HG536_0H03710 [Torulaspora globosa]QLL34995.1 hypothetical protein HG536_0H03710 [Torulaspora globosa]